MCMCVYVITLGILGTSNFKEPRLWLLKERINIDYSFASMNMNGYLEILMIKFYYEWMMMMFEN